MMHFLRYGVAMFMMMAGIWVGMSLAMPYAKANALNSYNNNGRLELGYINGQPCSFTRYGRCQGYPQGYGNGYGQSVDYPNAAVQSPGPNSINTGNAVQNHANWMYNQQRYERVNNTYTYGSNRRNRLRSGSQASLGPNNRNRNYRQYPSYGSYAYRQQREALRTQQGDGVYREYRQTTTYVPNVPQSAKNTKYITTREAKIYAALYKIGATSKRRPKGSVVGRAAKPWPPSHYGR
jgi:hypothetical protein